MLEASDRAVRSRIEKNGTADKVWGIIVDAYDNETIDEVKEYSNLHILEFGGIFPDNLDLSLAVNFPELQRIIIEQRNRKAPPVKIKNLATLNQCKKINQIHFFNVEINEEIDFSGMEKLSSLNLRHCKVQNLDFVKNLPRLIKLEISGNFVNDISGVYGHKRLRVITVDNEFVQKFDIETLRKKNPRLRIEVHSRLIGTDEDPNINHPMKHIDLD